MLRGLKRFVTRLVQYPTGPGSAHGQLSPHLSTVGGVAQPGPLLDSDMKRIKYYADFITYPLLIIFLMVFDRARLVAHPLAWLSYATTGFLMWTLAEYWIHRAVLHGPFWMRLHEVHHKRPKDLTDFPVWQIPAYFLVIYLLVWVSFGGWTSAAFAGVMVGWVLFFVMHHVMHHHPQYVSAFATRHNAHHRTTVCNYGITVDWWDRVFGTMRR